MDISIVIPLLNEDESLPELSDWIRRVMDERKYSFEVLYIDDGSSDGSWDAICRISANDARFKGYKFRRNYGKSAALNCGFGLAQGDVVFTMDADLQDSPEELPAMYDMVMNEKYDIVSGWKKKRYDPFSKTLPTKLFNWATRRVSGVMLHDFNCGLKAYRHDVVKNIEIYGEMHRYIPVIAKWEGYSRIVEKEVAHQSRKYGTTKFGLERFIYGLLDLVSITFVSKFGKKPMHFFGTLGTFCFVVGLIIASYLVFAKFFWQEYKMTERPLFYFGLLAMIIGSQLFLTGFLADMISRNSPEKVFFNVEAETVVGGR